MEKEPVKAAEAPIKLAEAPVEKSDAEKAKSNISIAREKFVSSHGISSIVRPQFWILLITQFTLSNIVPILITALIFGIFLMGYLFGIISVCYSLYFLKCLLAIIANLFLTILNAIWFAFHALTTALQMAFTTILNTVEYYFLSPIINAVRFIAGILHIETNLVFVGIGQGQNILLQPDHAFAYAVPEPVVWGKWDSLFSFKWVKCGINPYEGARYVFVQGQNGASLYFPKIDDIAEASGIWAENAGSPDPLKYDWVNWYKAYTSNFVKLVFTLIEGIQDWVVDRIKDIIDLFSILVRGIPV